jgi:hypothetical protein
MPHPSPTSAIECLLARARPYAPPACHIPSQHQPLPVSLLASYPTHRLNAISHPNISHRSSPRLYQTLRTSCIPYPIPRLANIPLLAGVRPYAPSACRIQCQYQSLSVSSLMSDPTHQLHTISDRNISHYSSPRRCQTLRTFCMPYPILMSAIASVLARSRPYAPPECHIPAQCQLLFVSPSLSDPTYPLHAISHPNVSHCSSPRSYQTLRTSCMP